MKSINESRKASFSFNLPKINIPFMSKFKFNKKILLWVFGATAIIGLVLFFLIIIPVKNIFSSTASLNEHIKYTKDGFLLQNMTQVKRGVGYLKEDVLTVEAKTKKLSWTKFVPFLGMYYKDAESGLSAANHLTTSALLLVDSIYPNANLLGFSTDEKASTPLYGPEKVKALVTLFPKVAEDMDEIGIELASASSDLDKINPNRYPKSVRGKDVRGQILSLRSVVSGINTSFPDIKRLFEIFPVLTGNSSPMRYLVLFQNDKEIRPTGGFWTAYALFTFQNAQIVSSASGDMYMLDIDNKAGAYPPAPAPIKAYLKLDDWYIRDSNLSPDYKVSTDTLMDFWMRVPGVPAVDGVIAVDTQFVQGLLRVLGDVAVTGYSTPFTSENVVHELELYANVLRKMEKGRKDILGALMNEIINRAYGMPSGKYDDFLKEIGALLSEKHILMRFFDADLQTLAEHYKVAGRLVSYKGDYLHINDSNFGGRKANWWITEFVTQEIVKRGDIYEKVVTIDYENTGEYDAEWNTGYRDWVRVYVPEGAKLIDSSGSLNTVTSSTDLGKTVFTGYMAVDPLKKATLTLKYELPVGVVEEDAYKLLIQKQPGTDAFDYVVGFLGKKESFKLKTDREVVIK